MHVIILSDFAVPTGGSQKVAIESAKALAEAGVRVTFIHAVAGRDPRLEQSAVECIDLGLKDVWDRRMTEAAMSGVWDRAVRRILSSGVLAGRTNRDTILHLHQWTRAFSPAVFSAALDTGRPLVFTAHDYFSACPNGVYYRFDQQRPCGLRPLSFDCITARCDPKSFAHKAIRMARTFALKSAIKGRSFDVIHVSDRGRDILAPLLPDALRHHRIDNPIDVRRKPPASISADAPFAFVGRLTKEKGVVIAAEAARLAHCPISFIGDGPAAPEIRAANPTAEILGWRSGAEVEALLARQVRAVIAPSLWYETGPLTIDEAAAAGVSAIASDRCGAAERIVHGSTGLIVPPDPQHFARAMRDLAGRQAAQTFGHAAYDLYWARPPDLRAHARALIALYSSILAQQTPI